MILNFFITEAILIYDISPVNTHAGSGNSNQFDFDFYIENKSQILVYHYDSNNLKTLLVYGIDYSIHEFKNPNGSYIIFPLQGSSYGILAENEKISIELSLPISQESQYNNSSYLNLESLEYSLDYLTRICQIINRQVIRAVKVAEGSNISTDTLALKFVEPSKIKDQILRHSKHQFIEGDVEHWWHEDTNRGIRTRFSDDLLWLCFVVYEYINFTGDYSILDEKVPYVMGELLPDGVDEKYDIYLESEIKEDVYIHCIRAIDRSLDFGEHGLPKIGSGDWNDGLNTVGNKQKGESIWLRIFCL